MTKIPAGYSGTPLIKKLGIMPGQKLMLINQPADYFDLLGEDLTDQLVTPGTIPDFIHLFALSKKELTENLNNLVALMKKNPLITIWVSWYKKSAGIPTDITEDVIREVALPKGLVDIKVCAVSEQWSGLKLVIRKTNR
jgi:hypothetical protein